MNKIAIVTGASQGIGRGIALKLAKEGYDIAFSFFSATQSAEELCAEIQSTTAQRCAMYCVDMRKDGAGAKFCLLYTSQGCSEYISAVSADLVDAQILHINPGVPLLNSRRIARCNLGPLEYAVLRIRTDVMELCITMGPNLESNSLN